MLTIYLGMTGAGKTFCIQEEVDSLVSGMRTLLLSKKVFVCTARIEEWESYDSNPAIKIFDCSCEKLNIEALESYEVVIFDSIDLYRDDFLELVPFVGRLLKKVNVIVSLMEYDDEYEQLFLNASVINYMRLPIYEVDRIPEKFILASDKKQLKELSAHANHGGGIFSPTYLLIYRNGRRYMFGELFKKPYMDKKGFDVD